VHVVIAEDLSNLLIKIVTVNVGVTLEHALLNGASGNFRSNVQVNELVWDNL